MAYTGLTAKLTVGENEIAYISNWSIEETRDYIEVTKLNSQFKEKIPSLSSWTAKADGAVDFSTTSGQALIRDAMNNGTPVEVKFYLNYDVISTNHTYFTGSAYIDSLSFDISAEDKANISISLSGIGALTLTLPSA
jgi:Phage major tail protein 2.